MDLRHLRYFLAVAEEGHFGRAAERLHIVQPALSMQIKALEEELGTPLFTRTSRRVELTEAGTLLRVEAERTLAQAARAKSVVQRAARGEVGHVRIAYTGGAAFSGRLSADLRAFHTRYPDVELELMELPIALHAEWLLEDRLDIAYSPQLDSVFDAGIVADRIATWPWMVGMMDDHKLAAMTSIPTAALKDERFILLAADGRDEAQLKVLRRVLGQEPKVAYRVGNAISVLALAAAGLGLAFVPGAMGGVRIQNIQYRPLADYDTPTGLVLLSRGNDASGAVKAFVSLARGGI
jgi:DNA-binding transcriptional LysR family regulator